MTPNPRQSKVLDEVRARGSVTVDALAEQFGVTLQTVRRDVALLADAGLLARFHGGVRVAESTTENIAYRQRQQLNEQAKLRNIVETFGADEIAELADTERVTQHDVMRTSSQSRAPALHGDSLLTLGRKSTRKAVSWPT